MTSEKMKLYDDYKDGRIDRDSYKQRAEKISVQLDEIKRKIEDAKNSKKLLEQNELSDKIKLKDFLGIQKFDTEKLREVIKVIRVHSQDEIEIEWNFDDIFSEQAKSGMNPKTLQYLMGHSDIGVTMNTYTHLGLEDAKDEMIRMEELNAAKKELEKTIGEKTVTQKMFKVV